MWGAHPGCQHWGGVSFPFLQEGGRITQTPRTLSRRPLFGGETCPRAPGKHHVYLKQAGAGVSALPPHFGHTPRITDSLDKGGRYRPARTPLLTPSMEGRGARPKRQEGTSDICGPRSYIGAFSPGTPMCQEWGGPTLVRSLEKSKPNLHHGGGASPG